MVLVVEVKGGAAVETIGSTPHSCRSRLNKSKSGCILYTDTIWQGVLYTLTPLYTIYLAITYTHELPVVNQLRVHLMLQLCNSINL